MKNKLLLLALFIGFSKAIYSQSTCNTAITITAGTYNFASVNGTEVPTPVCASGGAGATAGYWYKYTPTQNYFVTITTDFPINNGIDNRVHIYTGNCGSLSCIAGDDDSGSGLLCVASFNATANTTYYIAFDNLWNNSGFTFELIEGTPPPAPPVTFSPQSFSNIIGDYKIAVADMNGDYLDDIVSVSSNNIYILYQQNNGSFNAVSFTTTTAANLPSWSMAIGDYNKDGYNDLLYGGGAGVSFFYSNNTGTSYTHFTSGNYVFSQRSNFVDINNDGHLDAFVCHDVAPNVYFLNNGSGGLTFHQGGMGDHVEGGNYGSIFIDYDNDGDQDLFIAKCRGGASTAKINELHRNNGNGTFTNVSAAANLNHPNQTWSSAWNDFDNDGDMDVIIGVSSFTDGGHLYMSNNGNGTFSDITAGSGWDTYSYTSIEYVSYDFNNDGWVDVFTDGRIAINNGNNTFTFYNVPANVGPVGDLNNDGFLDVQNGNTVYFSQPNGYNWIKLNLKGVQSNINGIGARIELYGAWGKQIRDVQAGIGFRNMGTLNPHFGIGTATSIDSVIVKWPSGNITKICNPPINTNLYVKEDENYSITASFNSSSTNLGTGDTLSLFDSSTNNPTQWQWNISPATGWQFVNGTTSNSQNPQIVFSNPGNYTIQLTVSNDCSSEVSSPTSVNVYSTAGIDDIESDFDVVTYPNPASNLITISINSNLTIKQLKIYNTLGSELFSEICNNSSISIDVSWLNSGYYLIIMDTSTGEKVIQRFIKK